MSGIRKEPKRARLRSNLKYISKKGLEIDDDELLNIFNSLSLKKNLNIEEDEELKDIEEYFNNMNLDQRNLKRRFSRPKKLKRSRSKKLKRSRSRSRSRSIF